MRVLVVYATVEGQTRTITDHIKRFLNERGHEMAMIDATSPPDSLSIDDIDAVICAGPVHAGAFPKPLRRYVHSHVQELMARPGAFISVSLTAAGDDADEMEELQKIEAEFSEETGWWPVAVHHAAGALKFTEYDYFRKWIMKRIARGKGQATDRDTEFTDWAALDDFLSGFLADIPKIAGKV